MMMTDLTGRDLETIFGFGLSEQQLAAVMAGMHPAVMIAGAGSGKTTSMSARIAWLVGSGYARPEQILGLTFTTKATSQLLDSARKAINSLAQILPDRMPAESSDPVISTYNSFAAGIVREFGALLGRDFDGGVLSEGARHQWAYRLVCSTDIDMSSVSNAPSTITKSLLSLDGELSELAIEPETVITHDRGLLDYFSSFSKHNDSTRKMIAAAHTRIALAQLVQQWRELKAERELLEFSDQVRLAREIVTKFPRVAADIRSRFAAALLDEYQDTSISQRLLLQEIFGDAFPLTAVGDPCQAIYGWRGASVENINDFDGHFPLADLTRSPTFPLTDNRRSGVRILEAANVISERLRAEHPSVEKLVPTKGERGEVVLGMFLTVEEELEWLTDRIANQHAAINGMSNPENIAVLSPTTKVLVQLRDSLSARGVPVQLHSAAGLLSEPLVVDLHALLTVVHEPTANPEFVRWASGVRWRIGARDLAALGRRAAEIARVASSRRAENVDEALAEAVDGIDAVDVVSLSDALFDLGDLSAYSPQARERFAAMAHMLSSLRGAMSEPLVELILRVMRASGIDIQSQLNERDHIAISAFIDLASDFTEVDGRVSLGAFLSRLADIDRFGIEVDFDQPVDPRSVQLLTIFKAKGLEFNHVYVPNMTNEGFPGGRHRGNWTTDSSLVPWPIRPDAPDSLKNFPDYSYFNWPARVHKDEYLGEFAQLRELDADRLAYVAFTRAKDSLTITGSWWGTGLKKPRSPHPYLLTVKDHFVDGEVSIAQWVNEPGLERPSDLDDINHYQWPEAVPEDVIAALNEQSVYVHNQDLDHNTLNQVEWVQVESWVHALERLREERSVAQTDVRKVALPASVGASTMLRALREPEELAQDLARPMPRRSSAVASRGTLVHELIEKHYTTNVLFDYEELVDSTNVSADLSADVEQLRAAFLRSRFADMTPAAVEQNFILGIGGTPVSGYIDAVFHVDGRYLVVDWKTGTSAHVDPMQLAIYRLAWARIKNIDWRDVDTCFVMLAEDCEITPDTDALVEELIALG